MTADFALSLSIEGIHLLHRAADGWGKVGHVDVASPTLDQDLAELRAAAQALAPDGLHSKLVIPRDQIKFITLDLPEASTADIHAALEGATPYSLLDLEIDHVSVDGKTHIAAVARETLQEAESFADGHGFRPVAFVAVAPEGTFPQEVFFGPTTIMEELLGEGAQVARGTPPVVTGTRLKLTEHDPADAMPDADDAPQKSASVSVAEDDDTATDSESPDQPEMAVSAVAAEPAASPPTYFDRIIPEVRPEPLPPSAQATAPIPATSPATTAEPAPPAAPAAPVAPVRAEPSVQPDGAGRRIAAGLFIAVTLGAALFALTRAEQAPDIASTPASMLQDTTAAAPSVPLQAAPEVGDLQVTGLQPVAPAPTPTPETTQTARPLSDPTVPALAIAEAGSPPDLIPSAPPPPPADPAPSAAALARAEIAGRIPTPDEARDFYDATGVWLRAPRFFDEPSGAITLGFAAPATTQTYGATRAAPAILPEARTEFAFSTPADPPPPDAQFDRDERGFVRATPEGAVTPEGAIVFAGLPEIDIVPRPALSEEELDRMAMLAPAPDGVVIARGEADVIPVARPSDLAADIEAAAPEDGADLPGTGPEENTASLGSVGIAGLELTQGGNLALDPSVAAARGEDDLRPQLRPQGLAPVMDDGTPDLTDILEGVVATDATLRFDSSTPLAIATSLRPEGRPTGFGDRVAAIRAQRATERLVAAAAAANTPDEPARPVIQETPPVRQSGAPVPGGVSRAATLEDAIRLRDINLIGVYGRPSERRALVRLSNGRYVRVEVGSELDGGQVVAIGDTALNYVKRGRTYAIDLPDG